ncbi:hypothetical protein HDE_12755 [Halotydeus destructor]|nr:hypothetical protein HDE_12755 [Halotydeus destructor]
MVVQKRFRFSFLNDDCFQDILKYLDAKDRILDERVCRRFRENLKQVWRRQQAISFRKWDIGKRFCCEPNHLIVKADCVSLKYSWDNKHMEDGRMKIIKRCPNLKVLVWDGKCPVKLGIHVNRNLARLEHLEGIKRSTMNQLLPRSVPNLMCSVVFSNFDPNVMKLNLKNMFLYDGLLDDDVTAMQSKATDFQLISGVMDLRQLHLLTQSANLANLKAIDIPEITLDHSIVQRLPPQKHFTWRGNYKKECDVFHSLVAKQRHH